MKVWPVPDSFTKNLPEKNKAGSFWEDRGDRHHCGVDIYAPVGSDVVATESGIVLKTGVFTSPEMNPYWNITYFVVLKHDTGLISKYAELLDATVSDGESLAAGQVLGHVGCVLDVEKITGEAPLYVQELKRKGNASMLHFELFKALPTELTQYAGGNVHDGVKPENLLDATDYLKST
jgi:murein DD-endopeptidase MepM/ murein hydrolase activator NlpD